MHLYVGVSEEGGDGEGVGSESPYLLSYTLSENRGLFIVVYYESIKRKIKIRGIL